MLVFRKLNQQLKLLQGQIRFNKSILNGPAQDFNDRKLLKQHSHDILLQPDFYDNLKQMYPEKQYFSAYVGFDPTADSLHLGNLIQIIAMIRLSYLGIKPILLVGGATGQIGDPSGKSTERQMLSKQQVQENINGVENTLKKVTNSIYAYVENKYNIKPQHAYEIVNNYEHYKDLNMIDFIRDVGKHFRMGNLLSKETISSRINTQAGLSYTEFTYTILQGYDYEKLFLDKNCIMQIGGSDQWGNILSGQELIKKKHKSEVYCMTIPLITTASGQKFGKSEGNAIWVDLERQNSYDLYQYLYNIPDELAVQLLQMFTFIPDEEIKEIENKHNQNTELRIAQQTLAQTLVDMLSYNLQSGQSQVDIKTLSKQLFQTNFQELANSDSTKIKEYFQDYQQLLIKVSLEELKQQQTLQDILINIGSSKNSKSEIRRTIQNKGLQINGQVISVEDAYNIQNLLQEKFLMNNKYMVIRNGKKNYTLIEISN